MTTSIETASGLYLDYVNPRPEQIAIGDIAKALSHIPRFGGHTSQFYSVARHAVLVMDLVIAEGCPSLALAALHHDSHEAYVGDIPSPLKELLDVKFQVLVQRLDFVIASSVGCWSKDFKHPVVKEADALAMRLEASAFKKSRGLGEHWGQDELPERPSRVGRPVALSPASAETSFLIAHRQATELQR